MKELSLVFFVYLTSNKDYILLGKYTAGKRMPGIRNGFGGKCEIGETTAECAVREVKEETGLDIGINALIKVGKIIDAIMCVDVYIVVVKEKFQPMPDSDEFVDVRWFDVRKLDTYVPEMLPKNEQLMNELIKSVDEYKRSDKVEDEFIVDERSFNDEDLVKIKSNILN